MYTVVHLHVAVDIWDYVIVIIMADPRELTKLGRRRGVAKGSMTRIDARLGTLEGETDHPNTRDSARQMLAKLKEHDAEFRKIHLTLIDLIDDDEAVIAEQATLDEHDDLVASLCTSWRWLTPPTVAPPRRQSVNMTF